MGDLFLIWTGATEFRDFGSFHVIEVFGACLVTCNMGIIFTYLASNISMVYSYCSFTVCTFIFHIERRVEKQVKIKENTITE